VGRVEGAHRCLGREGRREGGEMDEKGSREGEREKRRKKGRMDQNNDAAYKRCTAELSGGAVRQISRLSHQNREQ